jgi:glucose/arabinose dehydrogenase
MMKGMGSIVFLSPTTESNIFIIFREIIMRFIITRALFVFFILSGATHTLASSASSINNFSSSKKSSSSFSSSASVPLDLKLALNGIGFPVFSQSITGLFQAPGDDTYWYVLIKNGWLFRINPSGGAQAYNVAIDLRTNVDDTGEGGLLGVAFHPNFASNRFVYLSFTETSTQVGTALVSYVSRFKASADGSTLDKNSRLDILKVNQPFSNHNGGNISFGPDGYLYVGFGDGGNANDPLNNAQNKSVLLGKTLRINVNSGSPYSIPADNPFANGGGAPEVFAYGLRNPWRWNFDTATGKLWVADVGQSFAEEINIVEKGGNYGWVCREGLKINKRPSQFLWSLRRR